MNRINIQFPIRARYRYSYLNVQGYMSHETDTECKRERNERKTKLFDCLDTLRLIQHVLFTVPNDSGELKRFERKRTIWLDSHETYRVHRL